MSKNILIVVNAAPYGSEHSLSALRLALALVQNDEMPNVQLFLMSDGVNIALSGQDTADRQTHELMLKEIIALKAEVLLCKTCVAARGLQEANWIEGTNIGTINDLANWTLEADVTFSF